MATQTYHIALNAHLLSGEATYRTAGIHGYLFNTLAHLPAVSDDFTYTVFVGQGSLPDNADWRVRRSRLHTQNPVVRIIWEQTAAPFALRQDKPDLLHSMAFATPVLWNGPSVVTIFDLSFMRYPERLPASRRVYLQKITRLSARRARRVIAISESGKQEIEALLNIPAEKIDVAYPGLNPDFRPLPPEQVAAFRTEHNLPDRYMMYLGTLEPRKNLETLLKAYAWLPQRGEVKLVLAGAKGWQTSTIFKLIETLNLKADILLPGYIPGNLLPMWYNAADIFAYPSVYEGFGMPLTEALACGTPAVAANTTSLPEAVGKDGVLLPPTDVEAWVETIARLLDSADLRKEEALRGQHYVRQFKWENTARKMAATYRRALSDEGTGAHEA